MVFHRLQVIGTSHTQRVFFCALSHIYNRTIRRYHTYRVDIHYIRIRMERRLRMKPEENSPTQEPTCQSLISDTINLLNEAIDVCMCPYPPPPVCTCSATIATCLTDTIIDIFENLLTGRAFLYASFCEGCDTVNFRFIVEDTGFVFTFCSTTIDTFCCTSLFVAISGTGTFVTGTFPVENLQFSLGFGRTTTTQCSYNLTINEPGEPPFFIASDTVNCADIRITPLDQGGLSNA